MNTSRFRAFAQLEFKDPEEYLRKLGKVEPLAAVSTLTQRQKSLRTHSLKIHKTRREAALFCYGIKVAAGNKSFEFAISEDADHDAVFRRIESDTIHYTPIQLKEVVPSRLNPEASLEKEIVKLEKYADSQDLVVGIYLNKRETSVLGKIAAPKVNVSGIWAFGCCSHDRLTWFLFGDLLSEPKYVEFEYPR